MALAGAEVVAAVDHRGRIRGPHARIHPFPASPTLTGAPRRPTVAVDFHRSRPVRGMDLPRPASFFREVKNGQVPEVF